MIQYWEEYFHQLTDQDHMCWKHSLDKLRETEVGCKLDPMVRAQRQELRISNQRLWIKLMYRQSSERMLCINLGGFQSLSLIHI